MKMYEHITVIMPKPNIQRELIEIAVASDEWETKKKLLNLVKDMGYESSNDNN